MDNAHFLGTRQQLTEPWSTGMERGETRRDDSTLPPQAALQEDSSACITCSPCHVVDMFPSTVRLTCLTAYLPTPWSCMTGVPPTNPLSGCGTRIQAPAPSHPSHAFQKPISSTFIQLLASYPYLLRHLHGARGIRLKCAQGSNMPLISFTSYSRRLLVRFPPAAMLASIAYQVCAMRSYAHTKQEPSRDWHLGCHPLLQSRLSDF
ncbi:hypothetical protein HDV57DRAFT_119188 [Trichoderma longibrachiatum]